MRKLTIFMLGLLFASSLQLQAAYLKNISKTITQPDGTKIECFASGDEYHNWLHDKDNYTIIQGRDGFYYYAKKEGDNIVPSEYKVGEVNLKSTDIEPGVNISASEWRQKRVKKMLGSTQKSHKLKNGTAEVKIDQICIYIRFKDDAEWEKDTATYFDWLNDETPSAKSMINFFKEMSYGKVEVHSHFYPKSTTATVVSYQDTENRGYFQPYNETSNPEGYDPDEEDRSNEKNSAKREWDLLERAINYFNDNYTVPSSIDLDYDDDGFIDNIEFFILGEAGEWSELLWPHNWGIYDSRVVKIGDIRVLNYNFQIEEITDQREVGVLSHEMGHALGYPDLYRYAEGDNYNPVGAWDIMASTARVPQGFGAHTKFKYGGWIDNIPEITTAGTYSINPMDSATNNCYKIASPYTTDEYFVVEFRKKAGRFEVSLPGSGLLVYRINTTAGNGNAQAPPDEVYIYRPGGTLEVNGNINQAAFSSTFARTEINTTTDPKPFLSNGSIGGLYISEISSSTGKTISFRVDFNPDALYPDFSADEKEIFAWETINFSDLSLGTPETWEWTFEGGNPSSYNGQNPPEVQYSAPGTYDVVLTVTKESETLTETREDYVTVSELPFANAPRELSAEVTEANPNDVVLNWTAPESGYQTESIQWDDGRKDNAIGLSSDPGAFDILSRWEPDDLEPYNDLYLIEIRFYPNTTSPSTVNNYTLKVYTGAGLGTLAVEQAIPTTDITFNQWNTIKLNTPLQIDASEDLWFGVHHDSGTDPSGFPFGVDNGPAIAEKGDIIYDPTDGSFVYLSAEDFDANWNLSATIANSAEEPTQKTTRISRTLKNHYKTMQGYNIYRDGVKVNSSIVSGTTYTETSVADGSYDYTVTAVYTAGESLASDAANINVPYSVGIPDVEIEEITIYPNPVKEKVYVQLEESSNEELTINIFDQAGKLAYSAELVPSSNKIEIPVNNLANGVYTLVMYNSTKAYKSKFVIMK